MTQNDLKYYSSLLKKKFRFQENKFLAEGKKIVEEGINSKYWCEKIFISQKIYENLKGRRLFKNIDYEVLNRSELMRLTDTVAPQGILGVFRIREIKKFEDINSNIIVFLENISDPGNLGTIVRICDWFGINTILCSDNTVDAYNPKVIRSSMGSIFHLDIIDDFKTDSLDIFLKKGYKLVSTDLSGKNLYEFKIADKIIISFSNETTGPSESLLNKSDYKITIPKMGKAESLNVAAASAVILAELTQPFVK